MIAVPIDHWSSLHSTPMGYSLCHWRKQRIHSLRLHVDFEPASGIIPLEDQEYAAWQCRLVGKLEGAFEKFFAAQKSPLPWSLLDVDDKTEFTRKVLYACFQIPPGKTRSYKELAEQAGSPLACRAVGRVMATNSIPLFIPCHRVLGSGKSLGGFSAPGGLSTKQWLLDRERRD